MGSVGRHSVQYGRSIAFFTAILLVAAFLRLVAFNDVPPGLQHDEMFKALEGRRLADVGDFRVFYATNQGHEGGFVWFEGLSAVLFGTNVFAVRFPAFVFGLLTVALTIRMTGVLFGRRAAGYAGVLAAVTFFAIFTSRIALRAVMLPVFVAWLILALYAVTRPDTPVRQRWLAAVGAGLALGLSIYTYTSFVALWGGFFALCAALVIFARPRLRLLWPHLLVIALIGGVLSLPMLMARFTHPDGFNRSSSIAIPLQAALDGNVGPLLNNAARLLGMPAFTGDPEARYNVPERPFFILPIGIAVYVGAALILLRIRRQPVMAALAGVVLVGVIPSLLTNSAPSFLRSIPVMPVFMACAAVALAHIPRRAGVLVSVTLLLAASAADIPAYFREWGSLPEVAPIYRDDLEQLADAVRSSDAHWFVSTPNVELDAMMFSIYAGERTNRVTFFDGMITVAFADGEKLAISPLMPLTPPHQPFIAPEYGVQQVGEIFNQDGSLAFTVYDVHLNDVAEQRIEAAGLHNAYLWPESSYPDGDMDEWAQALGYPINFGNLLLMNGVELSDRRVKTEFDGVNLQVFMQPQVNNLIERYSLFVHVYRQSSGRLHAQRDMLGVPALQWRAGSQIIQDSFVVMGPSEAGDYIVAAGVYDIATGVRLPVLSADGEVLGDRVIIGRVEVGGN